MKKIWLSGFIILGITACEKDDICGGGESETPNVVIEMFDRFEPETLKRAVKIALIADGHTDTIFYTDQWRFEVPLQINTTETQWSLLLYEPPTISGNDTIIKRNDIRFIYNTEEFYVSKACGYKVNFLNFNANLMPSDNPNESWIQNISRLTTEITNKDDAHIYLYY